MCPSALLPVFPPPPARAFTRSLPFFARGSTRSLRQGRDYRIRRAVEKSRESSESEVEKKVVVEGDGPTGASRQGDEPSTELNDIGMQVKEAMERRKEKGAEDLLSGVGEEIREIEWPAFGKVLGTTGVVLGVIAGSSVGLLTVNAILAEISDKVFAGKGLQDFFG
ncbi:hypothetical protein MLD38_016289 [Melastoma candidum]|uniref:Uncharacterized protein n=1 Tax=Melastoma candidum TaxID=119954 RepID=A0ACB9RIZ6_9MYRT|nr:hypothetical protein MLD38_016289 [Melastoma candidum]